MSTPEKNNLASRLFRLQSYLAQDPDNLNLLAEIADTALTTKEYETARSTIEHALSVTPNDPYFKLRLSTLNITENKLEESLSITSQLIAEDRTDPAVRFNHAFVLAALARYEEARKFLAELYAEGAEFPTLPHLLIRSHHYLGEIDEAISIAHEYIGHHPEDGQILGMLSLLYFDNDNLEQAKVYAERTLEVAPDNLDALIAASGSALGFEEIEESRSLLNKALEIQPTQGRAWVTLGLIDLLDSDLRNAQKSLEKAIQYMPEHIGSWHVLAWAQLLQNDIQGAESSFLSALAIDENFGETHGGLAVIAAMKGEWDKASELSKVAKRLNPESMSPLYAQILQLQHQGHTDLAQRLTESALKNNTMPNGSSLLEFLGKHIKK